MCSQFLALPSSNRSVVSLGEEGLMNEASVLVILPMVGGATVSDTLVR